MHHFNEKRSAPSAVQIETSAKRQPESFSVREGAINHFLSYIPKICQFCLEMFRCDQS